MWDVHRIMSAEPFDHGSPVFPAQSPTPDGMDRHAGGPWFRQHKTVPTKSANQASHSKRIHIATAVVGCVPQRDLKACSAPANTPAQEPTVREVKVASNFEVRLSDAQAGVVAAEFHREHVRTAKRL